MGKHHLRSLARPIQVHGHTFLVSTAMSADTSFLILSRFRRDLWLMFPAVLIMASLAGHCLGRNALKPIADIVAEARRINDRNLETRLPVANSRDELALLAETLNQMLARIDAAFRSARSFTANASHELRTPISLIRTRVETALCFPRTDQQYRQILKEVQSETIRMTSLVENLLALARADAGADERTLEVFDITELLHRSAAEWTHSVERLALHLKVAAADAPLFVLGDPAACHRLLRILLDNACRYTPAAGQITLCLAATPHTVELGVRDTGIGIANEDLPFIFNRFYRAAKPQTQGAGGSGLGLALAKWIAEQQGSSISVESEPGKGSYFHMHLPRQAFPSSRPS